MRMPGLARPPVRHFASAHHRPATMPPSMTSFVGCAVSERFFKSADSFYALPPSWNIQPAHRMCMDPHTYVGELGTISCYFVNLSLLTRFSSPSPTPPICAIQLQCYHHDRWLHFRTPNEIMPFLLAQVCPKSFTSCLTHYH